MRAEAFQSDPVTDDGFPRAQALPSILATEERIAVVVLLVGHAHWARKFRETGSRALLLNGFQNIQGFLEDADLLGSRRGFDTHVGLRRFLFHDTNQRVLDSFGEERVLVEADPSKHQRFPFSNLYCQRLGNRLP